MIFIGIVACGSKDTDTKNGEEAVQEAQVTPTTGHPSEESVADTETNEELGVVIRKDNDALRELGWRK